MAIVTENSKQSLVFYQEWDNQAEIPGEPAIAISNYSDTVQISQDGNSISISHHELVRFANILKAYYKDWNKK